MKKIILTLALLLLAIGGLMQIDDDLNPQAQAWLDQFDARQQVNSPGFDYLQAIHKSVESGEFELPKGEMFCNQFSREDCYLYLYQQRSQWQTLINKNKTLLNRYEHFMQLKEFRNTTAPKLDAEFPDYRVLIKGQRLSHLKAWLKVEKGDKNAIMPFLTERMYDLRIRLAQADDMVYKMVVAAMLNENLNMQGLMALGYQLALPHIARLTQKERSLKRPVLREFAAEALLYRKLDRSEQFFSKLDDRGQGGKANGLWVRALFKPNMSLNQAFEFWKPIVSQSELAFKNYQSFKSVMSANHNQDEAIPIKWRNYVGSVLAGIAKPNYEKYIA